MIKKTTLLILILISIFNIRAQTVLPPSDTYINLELVSKVVVPDSLLNSFFNPMNALSPTDTLLVSVTMIVPDTNVINKIHIKLGSTLGGNDLVDQQFIYDTVLNSPQVYERESDMIKICFGEYLNSSLFYCEVKLEDHLGNFSTTTNCQSNQ